MAFSHRDRRAHRNVTRGFVALAATVAVLTVVVLALPVRPAELVAVGALVLAGAAYLIASSRFLDRYSDDLRRVRDGAAADGFLRAEAGSSVGLDRSVGRPSTRSPHSRVRPRADKLDADPPDEVRADRF